MHKPHFLPRQLSIDILENQCSVLFLKTPFSARQSLRANLHADKADLPLAFFENIGSVRKAA